MHKQIRVSEKTHKQVAKIAEANYRGIGDQVAFWAANDCPHPVEMRQELDIDVAISSKDSNVGESTTLRIFYCKQCRKLVLNGVVEAELSEIVGDRVRK